MTNMSNESLFEFHRPILEKLRQNELHDLWTNVNKYVAFYRDVQDAKYIFVVEFILLYLIELEDELNEDTRRKQYSQIWHKLWSFTDHEHLENRWILLRLAQSFEHTPENETFHELNLQFTLAKNGYVSDLAKHTISLNQDEKKFIEQLKKYLLQDPYLGKMILDQFKRLFQVKPILRKDVSDKLETLLPDCLKDTLENNSCSSDNQFSILCDLLNVMSDDQILDSSFLDQLEQIANKFRCLCSDQFSYLTARFFACLVARDSSELAKKLCDIMWTQEKQQWSNVQCEMFIDCENGSLRLENCLRSIMYDQKHFLVQLLDVPLDYYEQLPKEIRLFYLLHHTYSLAQSTQSFKTQFYQLKELWICKLNEEDEEYFYSQDLSFAQVTKRFKWMFKFIDWCAKSIKQFGSKAQRKLLADLLQDKCLLNLLEEHGILNELVDAGTCFYDDLLKAIEDCGDEDTVTVWRAYSIMCLTISWIAHRSPSNDLHDEYKKFYAYGEMLCAHLNRLKLVTLRTELLENLFSLLFLTENDLGSISVELPVIKRTTSLYKKPVRSPVFRQYSLGTSETMINAKNAVQKLLFRISNAYVCTKSIFYHTTDIFVFPNYLVEEFLRLLKDQVEQTLTDLFLACKSKEESELHEIFQPPLSSVKTLFECRTRAKRLSDLVANAQWRYSVIQPPLAEMDESNKHRSMRFLSDETLDMYVEFGDCLMGEDDYPNLDAEMLMQDHCCHQLPLERRRYVLQTKFDSAEPSSIISAMLVSPQHLLRYCLIENYLQKAHQVLKLFEQQLKDTNEAAELIIIEQEQKLENKMLQMWNDYDQQKTDASKSDTLNVRLETSAQSELAEFSIIVDELGVNVSRLLQQFALCAAPSFELANVMLKCAKHAHLLEDGLDKHALTVLERHANFVQIFSKNKYLRMHSPFHVIVKHWAVCAVIQPQAALSEFERKSSFAKALRHIRALLEEQNDAYRKGMESPRSSTLINDFKKLMSRCALAQSNYLQALYKYVRCVNRVLNDSRNREGNTLAQLMRLEAGANFMLLFQNPSALLYKAVVEEEIPPSQVEALANSMHVDLLGTLCEELLPNIPAAIHLEHELFSEFDLNDKTHPAMSSLITAHLAVNFLDNQSHGLCEMYEEITMDELEEEPSTVNSEHKKVYSIVQTEELVEYFRWKSSVLLNVIKLANLVDTNMIKKDLDLEFAAESPLFRWIHTVQSMFGNPSGILKRDLTILALNPCLPASNETVLRYLEKLGKEEKWEQVYKVLMCLDLKHNEENQTLCNLRNALLGRLGKDSGDVKYALQISSPRIRAKALMDIVTSGNSLYANSKLAVTDLHSLLASIDKGELGRGEFSKICDDIEKAIKKVKVFSKIAELSGLRTWKDAMDNLNEIDILMILKTRKMYQLAYVWSSIRETSNGKKESEKIQKEIQLLRMELLAIALCENKDLLSLDQLLESNPKDENWDDVKAMQLLERIFHTLDQIDTKEFLAEAILQRKQRLGDYGNVDLYQYHLIGVRMLRGLPESKHEEYAHLTAQPKLLFEQMLMNMEFDALDRSLTSNCKTNEVRSELTYWRNEFDLNGLLEIYAKKALEIQLPSDCMAVPISGQAGPAWTLVNTVSPNAGEKFIIPAQPPMKSQWTPDRQVTVCMACNINLFSMIMRKHHCRRCGRVVCSSCSTHRLVIPQLHSTTPLRICDQCYAQFSVSGDSPLNTSIIWRLEIDSKMNTLIREEFYYEAAPSSSLCLLILKLHSDKLRCASIIVDDLCRPLFSILGSHEVDYGLLLDLLKSLLSATQMLISDHEVDLEVEKLHSKIRVLMDQLDVIRMLVDANCINYDLIRMIIGSDASLVGLQERLIELEHYELALCICRKLGSQPHSIWKVWAMMCLRCGKFAEARARFKFCFDPKTSNETSVNNSKLLREIMDILYERRLSTPGMDVRARCKLIMSGNASAIMNKQEGFNEIVPSLREECEHYVTQYGGKEDLFRFYAKFKLINPAIELLKAENKNTAICNHFIQEMVMPAIVSGGLDKLLSLVANSDPKLERLNKPLLSICKYSIQNRLYSILHQVQLFMEDYLRAAFTRVNYFFLYPPPSDYIQLYHRIEFLKSALDHCHIYLESKSTNHNGVLKMKPEEVAQYIRSLNLQIQITENFYQNSFNGVMPIIDNEEMLTDHRADTSDFSTEDQFSSYSSGSQELGRSKRCPLVLLNENSTNRTNLAALVLIYGDQSTFSSFSLAQEIIKEYQLDEYAVLRIAGKVLTQSKIVNVLGMMQKIVECVRASGKTNANGLCDEFVGVCIRYTKTPESIEQMAQMIHSDIQKIDVYLRINRLKKAYCLAAKINRLSDIKRIHAAACASDQKNIRKICEIWLKENGFKH